MDELEILICPHTKNPLRVLDNKEISALNQSIEKYAFYSGETVDHSIENALTDSSGNYIYLLMDNIFFLLKDLAILKREYSKDDSNTSAENFNTEAYRIVKHFYESFGWQLNNRKEFNDGAIFNDSRGFSKEYVSSCHVRVNKYLGFKGDYIVDIASGPIQHDEYLAYSQNFNKRICIDISISALKGAQSKIGSHGIYILGDITDIPLKTGSVDAAISLHTIYHVDKDKQIDAFKELYRIIKENGRSIILYSQGNQNALNIAEKKAAAIVAPFVKAIKGITKSRNFMPAKNDAPQLYFYAFPPAELSKLLKDHGLNFKMFTWRIIDMYLIKRYLRSDTIGRLGLKLASYLEDHFPKKMSKIGQYPIILIDKSNHNKAAQ